VTSSHCRACLDSVPSTILKPSKSSLNKFYFYLKSKTAFVLTTARHLRCHCTRGWRTRKASTQSYEYISLRQHLCRYSICISGVTSVLSWLLRFCSSTSNATRPLTGTPTSTRSTTLKFPRSPTRTHWCSRQSSATGWRWRHSSGYSGSTAEVSWIQL